MPHPRPSISLLAATLIGVAIAILAVVIHRPDFGNMDDSVLIGFAGKGGPWVTHYFGDPSTGFLRQASWVLLWPQYAVANATLNPTLLYAMNAVVVFGILFIAGVAAKTYFEWSLGTTYVAFVGAAMAWPYFSEILIFPSLQEKAVLLGAALLLWWSGWARESKRARLVPLLLIGSSAIALTSKVPIILFVPGLVVSLWVGPGWSHSARRWRQPAMWIWVAGSIALLMVALTATYAASTRGSVGVDAISDRRFLMILTIAVLFGFAIFVRRRVGLSDARDLVPFVWLLTWCAAFLVWEVRNYYLAATAICVATVAASVVSWFEDRRLRFWLAIPLLCVGLAMVSFRTSSLFEVTRSFRVFLESDLAIDLDMQSARIAVTCIEAPNHFNRYAAWSGLHNIRFIFQGADPVSYLPTMILADSYLCPVGDADSRDRLWESDEEGGYILYGTR